MALVLFTVTLFVSAFILFLVQPIIGKMILPKLGGTPQVWNTCMVFFQAALLAGYTFTHITSKYLRLRTQLMVQAIFLFVPLLVLLPTPYNFTRWVPPLGSNPIWATLLVLAMVVGLPFMVVATISPLLQRWFGFTGHPASKDPYFLSVASNAGSLLSLLSYPILIEPYLLLNQQAWVWMISYGVLIVLIMSCAYLVYKAPTAALETVEAPPPPVDDLPPPPPPPPSAAASTSIKSGPAPGKKKFGKKLGSAGESLAPLPPSISTDPGQQIPTVWTRLRWVLLGAVPSSLMLGVTSYISTDLSPIPLLWIVPLALYLTSFIQVFWKWEFAWVGPLNQWNVHRVVLLAHFIAIFLGAHILVTGGGFDPFTSTLAAIGAFYVIALVCHGELARCRPPSRFLTEFYLLMSVGGVLGGIFNALIAPLLFWGVLEFPLALVLACYLRPQQITGGWIDGMIDPNADTSTGKSRPLNWALDFALPIGVVIATGLLIYITKSMSWDDSRYSVNPMFKFLKKLGFAEQTAARNMLGPYYIVTLYLPLLACFFFHGRPLRLGHGVALVLFLHLGLNAIADERSVYADRSYFGVLRVRKNEEDLKTKNQVFDSGISHSLMHGTTHHGMNFQFKEDYPKRWRRMATTYYHQYGPAGIVMKQYNWFNDGFRGETPEDWFLDMIEFKSDARLPASIVGLGALPATMPLPLEQVTAVWSEPPFGTIGLGTGTMAAYSRPFQHCHYYEIDNKIRRLSLPESGERLIFNYLHDANKRGADVQVRMGDARLRMALPYKPYSEKGERDGTADGGGPDRFYHMMVVDAFSSDAIPVHLITKEAIEMYMEKLVPDGILCVHTSNRHVDLVPVVASVAEQIPAEYLVSKAALEKLREAGVPDKIADALKPLMGKTVIYRDEFVSEVGKLLSESELNQYQARILQSAGVSHLFARRAHDISPWNFTGHFTSEWVMVARNEDLLRNLKAPKDYEAKSREPYWEPPSNVAAKYVWTDDYSNVMRVFRDGNKILFWMGILLVAMIVLPIAIPFLIYTLSK